MTDIKNNIGQELLRGNFNKSSPMVNQLSDPIVDTPMVVTLEQLKPYELNPRVVRNPYYDDIKESIRARGLDTPPAITRRPDAPHYIIRNGGNTRLAILWELWEETKKEHFFKIHCLFRPWQNEIIALTGHLAENELHGRLTFIERALGIIKVNEIYENELGVTLTQKQLVQKLTKDGYPVSQTQISQMYETANYLLPIIPEILYGGLSRSQIQRILRLRKVAKTIWVKHSCDISDQSYTFDDMFVEVLSQFNTSPTEFDFSKYEDELTYRISQIFECSYSQISSEIAEKEKRQRILETPPNNQSIDESELFTYQPNQTTTPSVPDIDEADILALPLPPKVVKPAIIVNRTDLTATNKNTTISAPNDKNNPDILSNSTLPASFAESTVQDNHAQSYIGSIEESGPSPFDADIWYISPTLDHIDQLRTHIRQLVLEIAQELHCITAIKKTNESLGFICIEPPDNTSGKIFYHFLEVFSNKNDPKINVPDALKMFVTLLTGINQDTSGITPLSETSLIKLMRVIRLVRRFHECS